MFKKRGAEVARGFFWKDRGRAWRYGLPATGTICVLSLASPPAHAVQLYDGLGFDDSTLEISLDTTASYTGLYRVGQPSQFIVSGALNPNGNDGDANFRHGLVGNEFEILPVLDIKDGSFGMHFSGEYFINTVYLQGNQNNQASTLNSILPKSTDFASETRQANGMNGRMLDAFAYKSFDLGDGQEVTLKAGQQTLFWGQSLYFGTNGISGGQAPVDVIAAQDLVNPQSQQIYLPVGQIVATYQPNETYTLQGYYQYQWAPDSFQGVGSYFSTADVVGPGAQLLYAPIPGLGNAVLTNTKALTPRSQNGQFGLSAQATYGIYDVGLFTERFDAKQPEVATNLKINPLTFAANGNYYLIYPRDIWLYGTSLSTSIGSANVAGEFSVRTHMPLVSNGPESTEILGFTQPTSLGDANGNPGYPVGNTMTGLMSVLYGSPALKYDPGGVFVQGEVEYVDLWRVTANKALLVPGRSHAASAFDVQVTPAYLAVLPNLELQFPVSLSYNFAGNSEVDQTMNHGTGSWSAGVTATYRVTWSAALSYVGYFGNPQVDGDVDRSYVALNLQHTF